MAATGTAVRSVEPQPRVELLWYDSIARWLTLRAPSLFVRAIVRIHRLLVRDRLTPVQATDFQLAVSPQDNLGHNLFYYGTYEPTQVDLWKRLLGRGREMVVLDVGANVGYYSLLAAASANVSRVVSFEPNPLVLPTLRYNVALNAKLRNKVSIAEAAVGDAVGTVRFYRNFSSHNFGLGSMRVQTADSFSIDVPVVRLDTYLTSQGVDRVDLIKIDVEGAEHMVTSGLRGWWAAHPLPIIVVEVHPILLSDFGSGVSELFATLVGAGYVLRRLRADGQLEPASANFKAISWVLAEPSR